MSMLDPSSGLSFALDITRYLHCEGSYASMPPDGGWKGLKIR
jgi:hypothetical protein